MNPPTTGHEKLIEKLASSAGRNPYFIFVSQSQDKNKNPLFYKDKVKHVRKMFPKHARKIMMNPKVKTFLDALAYLYDSGYRSVTMVVGSDRVREFDVLLSKYNGQKSRHGFYNFENINVISAGERDPDSDDVSGMSASKQRKNAKENDFTSFAQGVPKNMSNRDARALFNDVRNGMGLKEQKEFSRHIQLEPVSEVRERFIEGDLFNEGDEVVVKSTGQNGTIRRLGSNYLVIDLAEGGVSRQWLHNVESYPSSAEFVPDPVSGKRFATLKSEKTRVAQDSDIKDRKGSQPAKYHRGLSKSIKKRRDAQFKRQSRMSDRDPTAYKPAPGDATAKTKPSKYTKAFKKMYGEDTAAVDAVKAKIKREKETDKIKHDRMLDRARLKDTRTKNKGTGNEKV